MSKGFITGTNEELIKAYKESRDESYLKELIEANKGLINLLVSPYLTSKAGCKKVLSHCDSFRLYQKYVEPNVEYMHNYYIKEVKGNAEICKRKNYSGERKAS